MLKHRGSGGRAPASMGSRSQPDRVTREQNVGKTKAL